MVHFSILKNSIVVAFDGKHEVVSVDDKRYEKIKLAIKENRLDDIPSYFQIKPDSLKLMGLDVRGSLIYDGEIPLPEGLSKKIIYFRDEGLPFQPLVYFWERLKKNPSFNARAQLFKFLEHNGHPFTSEGRFIAYRGVRDDFKDKHSGTFDNSPGQVCEMPREQVDDNPNNTCSAGLHVACYDYAKNFASTLVEVEVDPADVVAVPTDYNGTKMRTCRFKVLSVCEKMHDDGVYTPPKKDEPVPEFDIEYSDDDQYDDDDEYNSEEYPTDRGYEPAYGIDDDSANDDSDDR